MHLEMENEQSFYLTIKNASSRYVDSEIVRKKRIGILFCWNTSAMLRLRSDDNKVVANKKFILANKVHRWL